MIRTPLGAILLIAILIIAFGGGLAIHPLFLLVLLLALLLLV